MGQESTAAAGFGRRLTAARTTQITHLSRHLHQKPYWVVSYD
jgi:hypothetical protein